MEGPSPGCGCYSTARWLPDLSALRRTRPAGCLECLRKPREDSHLHGGHGIFIVNREAVFTRLFKPCDLINQLKQRDN